MGIKYDYEYSVPSDNAPPDDGIVIKVTTSDGGVMECEILAVFEACGREYIALLPMGDEAVQIDLFRYRLHGGKAEITPILSDMEFDAALDRFEALYLD